MTHYEDEIRLIDYLDVLWKRKWFIILPTFFCVVIAGLYSFLLPSQWEVDSIIQPPYYILQKKGGQLKLEYVRLLVLDFKNLTYYIKNS